MVDRVVFHADCNSFYASVELLKHPDIKEKPVAVSGSTSERHGIILAKNEAAKKYNVQTAETVWKARQKCPDLILLPAHHEEYHKYHKIINEIYLMYTDLVEPFGIDESWLDVSGSWQLFGTSPLQVAHKLRRQVYAETGLTVSVGVSFNKVFSKMGSDYRKPNAVTEITKENYKKILWPLKASDLLYVGKKTAIAFANIGITTIGDIANTEPELLRQMFGKQGDMLCRYACGEDQSLVTKYGDNEIPKSVGNGLTFKRDLKGYNDVRTAITSLADTVASRLRKYKLYASSIQVTIKTPDFKTITRQKPLEYSTNLAKDLAGASLQLINHHWNYSKPIRMLTVTAQQLSEKPCASQLSFFEKASGIDPKIENLEKSLDKIRGKFGGLSIISGGELGNDMGLIHSQEEEE